MRETADMPSGSRYACRKCCAMSSVTNDISQLRRFQLMKCEASEELTTSQAWMLLAYSWPSRWNNRSEPERSICTSIPGYFCSNALPSFSPTGRSIDEYRMTLPSFFAASTSSGVIATGAGLCASTRVDSADSPSAAAALMTSGRVSVFRMVPTPPRHCEERSDEAIQLFFVALDCFASL